MTKPLDPTPWRFIYGGRSTVKIFEPRGWFEQDPSAYGVDLVAEVDRIRLLAEEAYQDWDESGEAFYHPKYRLWQNLLSAYTGLRLRLANWETAEQESYAVETDFGTEYFVGKPPLTTNKFVPIEPPVTITGGGVIQVPEPPATLDDILAGMEKLGEAITRLAEAIERSEK